MDKFPSAGATDTPRQGDTQVLWPQDPRALAGRHVGGLGGGAWRARLYRSQAWSCSPSGLSPNVCSFSEWLCWGIKVPREEVPLMRPVPNLAASARYWGGPGLGVGILPRPGLLTVGKLPALYSGLMGAGPPQGTKHPPQGRDTVHLKLRVGNRMVGG